MTSQRRKLKRKHNAEETTLWLEHGVHIPSRALNVLGDIDDTMLDRVMGGLQLLEYHGPNTEVVVYLGTSGGDEVAGLGIYNILKSTTCPVDIIVVGQASSMGAIILQAARPNGRLMMPDASIMIHVGDKGYEGHAENVRREVLFDKKLDERCDRILLERMRVADPSLTLGKLRDMLTLDTYFDANEAIKAGLADKIWGKV